MRRKDTFDVLASVLAVTIDGVAVAGGFLLAAWLRFSSGWIPLLHDRPPPPDVMAVMYGWSSIFAAVLFLLVFRFLGLYVRPQVGVFSDKIPRLVRGAGLGILISTALAFAIRIEPYPPFSRLVLLLAFFVVTLGVILERYLLFRWELHAARHVVSTNRVLIIGTDDVAAHLSRVLQREPRLRSVVAGFVKCDDGPLDQSIGADMILGTLDELDDLIAGQRIDQVILASSRISHQRMVEIVLLCEKNMVTFNVVPDLFRIMLGDVDVQMVDDIPLLGVSRWPLDYFWNRVLKRCEDCVGAALGLLVLSPVIAVTAFLVKRSSPGPVFYRQERCGEHGRLFILYKLRTMYVEAGGTSGWTVPNDPRRTAIGAVLRKWNIDELPQLWNVLKGDMSLVGPRPEQPRFVEKFKDDINRYMWRHVSKPGLTGWAQVNGLRGDTSIEERIRCDLYYLEHWSLSFDFKIILKTFNARKNAY